MRRTLEGTCKDLKEGETVHWKRNSEEQHDTHAHAHTAFVDMVDAWHAAGANIIGGCCRVTPEDITAVNKVSLYLRKKHPFF